MSTEQDATPQTASPANGAAASEAHAGPAPEAALADMINRIEAVFRDGLKALGAQSKPIIDGAEDQLETAQKFVSDQVRNRPLTATAAALGVGVLVGLLLTSGRRR